MMGKYTDNNCEIKALSRQKVIIIADSMEM